MDEDIIYGEEFKIDEKDKKIIEALYKDGRATIAQIEKKTGIRRDSVSYRIKRLLKKDVLSCVTPIINPGKLGYYLINNVMIKTKIGTTEQEENFVRQLKNNKFIIYFASLSGRWDFQLTICAKNPEQFNEIMKEIRSIENNYIVDFEITTIVREFKFENASGLLD